jgi:hypothetical protein
VLKRNRAEVLKTRSIQCSASIDAFEFAWLSPQYLSILLWLRYIKEDCKYGIVLAFSGRKVI